VIEAYRKIRNTCRYLLANLYDFDPAADLLPVAMMQEVDRYALARYGETARAVLDAYRDYDFPTIFQRVNHLATVDLSAFYADVSKDRLYTFAAAAPERRSAQTAMYVIADGLVRLLAPVLPMTADELWRHLPGRRDPSVHIAEFPSEAAVDALLDPQLVARWDRLKQVRDIVNVALEARRQDKTIGTSLGAHVLVRAGGETGALLDRYRDELPMLFIVSQVDLVIDTEGVPDVEVIVSRAAGVKCARCWRVVDGISADADAEGLCERCVGAVATAA
jgi:isoleucyl-tRNA synthetase